MDLKELGRQIALARREQGHTQSQLAEIAGLSRQTISALERGDLTDLGLRKVLRLLDVLDLDLVLRQAGHRLTLDDLRLENARTL